VPEFGAVKVPATPEAIAVHHIENMDAKLMTRSLQHAAGGAKGRAKWTEYLKPFGGRLYRPDPAPAEAGSRSNWNRRRASRPNPRASWRLPTRCLSRRIANRNKINCCRIRLEDLPRIFSKGEDQMNLVSKWVNWYRVDCTWCRGVRRGFCTRAAGKAGTADAGYCYTGGDTRSPPASYDAVESVN